MEDLETCAASLAIGLSLGFIGAGGSILTIPVFVYVLKKDPASSGVYSMFVVGVSGLAGSVQSIVNRVVDVRVMLSFGIPSVTGVLIARKLIFPLIPHTVFSVGEFAISKDVFLMLCLSGLMLVAAFRMLKPMINVGEERPIERYSVAPFLLRGLLVGLVTGLLGIGGGFLIVPALYFFAGLPVKKSIGTALLLITINSLLSFVTSYSSIDIDWILLAKFSAGAVMGILIGTRLSEKISSQLLKRVFGWCVLMVAVYISYRQFFL